MDDASSYYQVGLEFDRIRWSDHSADFFAEAIALDPIASPDHAIHTERRMNWWDNQAIEYRSDTFRPLPLPGVANFVLDGSHVYVPKGFRMLWKTQNPTRSRNQMK
jgi:hypothetical protein